MASWLRKLPRWALICSAAGLLAAVLGIAWFRWAGTGAAKPSTVRRGDLLLRVSVAGTVVPKRKSLLMPPYSGYIQKLYVKVGDDVAAGAPVVAIAPSLQNAGDVFPLRAPFAGRVTQVMRYPGEYVEEKQEQSMMVRIDDLSSLLVVADVPEVDIPKVKLGQDVVVRAQSLPGKTYPGKIQVVSLASRENRGWNYNDKSGFPVTVQLSESDEQIKPGMSALIDIIADKHTGVLLVGHEFVELKGDATFITVEGSKGRERRSVKVGLQNEEDVEVLEGVSEGETIVPVDYLSAES